MKVKSQMKCIKKQLNKSIYNVRQSQAKMLDIQNNWSHDWKPLDQFCLYHSLCHIIFFSPKIHFFFSLQIFLCFFSLQIFLCLFSLQFHVLGNMTTDIFYFYIIWLTQPFIWSCVKEKGNWLGAQLWMNQVRCSVKE